MEKGDKVVQIKECARRLLALCMLLTGASSCALVPVATADNTCSVIGTNGQTLTIDWKS